VASHPRRARPRREGQDGVRPSPRPAEVARRRRPATAARFIKSPPARSYGALTSSPAGDTRCLDDTALAELLIEGDPEIDFEAAGRRTGPTDRVLLDPDGNVLYAAAEVEVVCDRRGVEVERRTPVDTPANVDGDAPLVWTGRMLGRSEAARRFAFTRNCRLRHVDGVTYDFLFAMAEELHKADSLVLVGAGPSGRDPIILERNGLPYRGFLEGRVRGDRYLLVLHLTSLELVVPVEAPE
jgi:hypothetical protein